MSEELVKTQSESFNLVQREAKALAQSTLIPKAFQGNIPDCIIAIEMARRIGAAPLAVLQNIHIIHGKPSWSSQFIIAVVNQCGRFKPLRFGYTGSGDDWACVAYTKYIDEDVTIKGPVVTMKMANSEGWVSKAGSKWKTMPELMLSYRAATFFGRLYCPDLLMGMQSSDEVADIISSKEQAPPEFTMLKADVIKAFESAESLERLDEAWGAACNNGHKDDQDIKDLYMTIAGKLNGGKK